MLSRVLGYIRDAVIALYFGAGLSADAFFVAFRISNLLRRLVGEGALTSAFIPVFTDVIKERSKEDVRRFVSSFVTVFFFLLLILAAGGIYFSGPLVELMAPGFKAANAKFELAVTLTRWMFPYMVFIGLMAIAMGVLNTYKHFTAPAIAPVFLNIAMIVSVVALSSYFTEPVYALVVGVLAGGVLQLGIQLPFLKRYGALPYPLFGPLDPATKRVFALMGPAIVGIGIYQLNIFVTMRFASTLVEGSVSYLYYASRLMELPLGVFAVSIVTVVLPRLSEYAAKKDYAALKESLSYSLRLSNAVTIPSTVGLIVLSLPIIDILFARGAFGAPEARETSYALYFYALGVVPVALTRILVSVFYSLKDTRTPVIAAFFVFICNIVFCILLIGPLRHGGLALATTISAAFNFLCLVFFLRGKEVGIEWSSFLVSALKCLGASLVMALVVYGVIELTAFAERPFLLKVAILGVNICLGALIYFTLCSIFKVTEVMVVTKMLRGKVDRLRDKRRAK